MTFILDCFEGVDVSWDPPMSSVRILGDGIEPHSTAIIVGPRCVISCAHSLNMINDPDSKSAANKLIGDDYWIATSVAIDKTGKCHPENVVLLKLYKFNQWNDWAIFRRCDDQTFSSKEIVTIDTNVNAELNYLDTRAQVIQCPVAFRNPSSCRPGDSINAWRTRITIQSQSKNHLLYEAASLSRGASGGAVFVYPSLKLIAMHQETFYEVEYSCNASTINMMSDKRVDSEERTEESFELEAKKQKKANDSETVKSLSGGNSGQGSATILRNCSRLMHYVNEINSV